MRARPAQETGITRIAFWVFLSFLPLYILVTRGHFQSTDEVAVFQQARSLWERGELSVTPQINSFPGRSGKYHAVYGAGQSVFALPLYAAGSALEKALAHNPKWTKVLAGPVVAAGDVRWGGEIPIFTVALFSSFVTALLCAVFFCAAVTLGASLRSALIGVALFGLSSQCAGYSSTFFQHPLETLLVLSCFYQLVRDSQEPSWRRRAMAGVFAGFMLVVRIQTLIFLPALSLFLLWTAWQRIHRTTAFGGRSLMRVVAQCSPYAGAIVAGVIAQFAFNYIKFEKFTFTGGYAGGKFESSLLRTLHGYFFSPGESIFLFTPLLVLMPLFWPPFYRSMRATAVCMLGLAASYILFYAKYDFWHGQWCFGPRYIMATVPFMLLPITVWWDSATIRQRRFAWGLGAIGVFVQVLSVAVNFSYVYHREKYMRMKPDYSWLFIPEISQPATHFRALLAGDHRLDMWLVNVYRAFGFSQVLIVALPLLVVLAFALWGLRRAVVGCERPESVTTEGAVASAH